MMIDIGSLQRLCAWRIEASLILCLTLAIAPPVCGADESPEASELSRSPDAGAVSLRQAARHAYAAADRAQGQKHLQSLLTHYRDAEGNGRGWRERYQWSQRLAEVAHEYLRAGELEGAMAVLGEAADLDTPFREGIDNGLASAAAAWNRRLAQLDANRRYQLLHAWTMPTESRDRARVLQAFVPDQAPPTVFARALGERSKDSSFPVARVGQAPAVFSSAWELVIAADDAGRLWRLTAELEQLAGRNVGNAAHLLTLARIAATDRHDTALAAELDERLSALAVGVAIGAGQGIALPDTDPTPTYAQCWQYGYGAVDDNGAVSDFTPFQVWSGAAWQATRDRPHPTLGFIRLDRSGGHTGPSLACIRRWRAPASGTVSISGTLHHPIGIGDGVRARAIVARGGVRGQWTVLNGTSITESDAIAVTAGDTIDFAVDRIENTTYDAFVWLFQLRLSTDNAEFVFDSFDDFCGPHERDMLDHAVVAVACLDRADLRPIGRNILAALIENTYDADTWMNRPTDYNSPRLRPALQRAWALAAREHADEVDSSWIDRTAMRHWAPAEGRTATQHARGQARRAWLSHEEHLLHVAGSGVDNLLLRYPLTGTFQFSVETQAGGRPRADGGVAYGGLEYLLDGGDRLLRVIDGSGGLETSRRCPNVRVQLHPGGRYIGQPQFNRATLTVSSGQSTLSVNGRAVWTDSADGGTAPWLALTAQGDRMPTFRRLRITGDPVIPREVRMSNGDSLRGWSASYYGDRLPTESPANDERRLNQAAAVAPHANHTVPHILARHVLATVPRENTRVGGAAIGGDLQPSEHDWFARDGVIHGLRRQAVGKEVAQSWLSYVRPLLDGESVSYEFLYEPDKHEAHPALGRLAFLMEPDGVRLHWITDGDREWTGLAEDNAVAAPFDRRGPRPLPLVASDWNKVTIAAANKTVTLSLNERLIYQRSLDNDEDRTFGFYHDACRTAVQVRNVVMRGDWPEQLSASQLARLASVTVDPSEADLRALNELFQERHLPEQVLQVSRHAASLPDEEQYAFLCRWVLPGDDHVSIRMVGRFLALAAPLDGQESLGVGSPLAWPASGSSRLEPDARLVAPAIQLVYLARQLGRLDELRGRLAAVASAQAVSTRPAMLALVALAADDFSTVNQHLAELVELNKLSSEADAFDRWPEMLVVWLALRHAETNETARELIELLNERVRAGTLGESDAWKHHLEALSAAGRYRDELKVSGKEIIVDPLRQWDTVSHVSARSRGQAFPASRWSRLPYRVDNVVAHDRDYLYFQSPLRGTFQVECDVTSTYYRREGSLAYGGRWAQLDASLANCVAGGYRAPALTGETMGFAPRLTDPGPWMRCRLAVQDGRMKVYFSGRLLHDREIAGPCDPWLAMRTHWQRNGGIRDIRISGQPIIPAQIDLLANGSFTGWLPYFEEPAGIESGGWRIADGELTDSALGQGLGLPGQVSVPPHESERLLHYHRPMLEDGAIEYEFYYEPGKIHAHPTLDRLAFLLEPSGVREHWVTQGEFDETGLDPANASDEPHHRRGPDPLPLVASDWNRVRFSLTGDAAAIVLNGQLVYERPLEATNLRNFGLFHYVDRTAVRVRNIVWQGDWPREAPALSQQELADVSEVESLAEQAPAMDQVVEIDFARQGIPRNLLGVSVSDRANKELVADVRPDGLHVSCPGPELPERNYFVMGPLFDFGGDFDITATYEGLETTVVNQPGTLCQVWLLLRFKNQLEDHAGLVRKHYSHGDHSIETVHSWGPSDARRLGVKGGRHDGHSGVLRMSRRGDKLYALLAEDEAAPFRVFDVFDVGPGDIAAGGFDLTIESYGRATTKIIWKRLTVRAERIAKGGGEQLAARLTPTPGTPPARYVRIDLPNKTEVLSLAEVEVYNGDKNVAAGKTASQSSVEWNGPAELAIDGSRNGLFFLSPSTTHTAVEPEPWWEVDLGRGYDINRILVWNRTDFGGERLQGCRIQLLDEQRNVLWQQSPDLLVAPKTQVDLD